MKGEGNNNILRVSNNRCKVDMSGKEIDQRKFVKPGNKSNQRKGIVQL